jgi:protein SCO1
MTKNKAQGSRFKAQSRILRARGARLTSLLRLAPCALSLVLLSVSAASAQPQYPSGYGNQPKPGTAASEIPPQLQEVTFEQRLNTTLPLDATFRDDRGQTVKLGDYFGRKPVVLAFVYLQCPMLCSQVMNGISSSLKVLPFTPGADFDVVLVSFDPRDTPQIAAEKKRAHMEYWGSEETAGGWHILTGDEANIQRVTSAAGFTYRWDEASGQFAHASGVLVATPDGRLSRYFYGVEFSPKELRLALVESGEGKVGSAIDQLLLYCYHYDPSTGQYGVVVMNLVRLGGIVTVVMMAGFILLMRRRDPRAPVARRA